MSYENAKCPCGGKKEPQTMLCSQCVAHMEDDASATFDLRHYQDHNFSSSVRRSMAVRLLAIAHRRLTKPQLPLIYQA